MRRISFLAIPALILPAFLAWPSSESPQTVHAASRASVPIAVAQTHPMVDYDAEATTSAISAWVEGVQRAEAEAAWYAGVQAEIDRQAVARRVATPPSTPTYVPAPPPKGGPFADAAECTRAHEGWYTANTGNGYYGAYQFSLGTWRNTVRVMGRDDLVNILPSDASPADQDAAFWFLWGGGAGASHWGGRCTEYA